MKLIPWPSLEQEVLRPYFKEIIMFLEKEIKDGHKFTPSGNKFFHALKLTSLEDTKVVFLNHEPYPSGISNGLAFGILKDKPLPKMLENIKIELKNDLGVDLLDYTLESWAKEGVLLLNSVLSSRKDQGNQHKDIGWEIFTERVFKQVCEKKEPVVFVLFGKQFFPLRNFIKNPLHKVIMVQSPGFGAQLGFNNSKIFSQINDFLLKNNLTPIKW